jgi:RNA polymerase sigma-70 factor (ECF subfamily)
LRAVAARIAGPAAVDDVVQDTLERVWRHAARFDASRGTLEAWAMRIGRNAAIAHLRRERGSRRVEGHGADLDRIADRAPLPEAAVEQAETMRVVRAAVTRLERDRRDAVECVLAGHTLVGAAAVLAIPEGTLKSRVRAAYAGLREDPPLVALVG